MNWTHDPEVWALNHRVQGSTVGRAEGQGGHMAWKTRLMVVANRTADSDDLLSALRERAARGPIAITLVVPQDSHGGLGERMTAALARFQEAGIEAHGMLGDT